nr:hypothetical protein [Tanacetum cinerariifolium]
IRGWLGRRGAVATRPGWARPAPPAVAAAVHRGCGPGAHAPARVVARRA